MLNVNLIFKHEFHARLDHFPDRSKLRLCLTAMLLLAEHLRSWGYYVILWKIGNASTDLRLTRQWHLNSQKYAVYIRYLEAISPPSCGPFDSTASRFRAIYKVVENLKKKKKKKWKHTECAQNDIEHLTVKSTRIHQIITVEAQILVRFPLRPVFQDIAHFIISHSLPR